jgi:hypothetical protein
MAKYVAAPVGRSLALAVLAAASMWSSLAVGQQYQADEVDDKARMQGPVAQNIIRDPSRYATDKDKFTEYFQKYYFPAMTRFQPDELAELGKLRQELFGRFLWSSRDENLQRDLTDMAYKAMKPVAFPGAKYHPAVRYNAVIVLGMLDDQYAIEQAGAQRPPKPHREANDLLTKFIDHAASGNRVQSAMVVGALVGLDRHARFADQLERGAPEKMSAAVVKLASKDDPLPEVDAEVTDWIRVQSAGVLAKLGKAAPKPEALQAMAKMIAGETVPKMSLDSRGQIAALLGTMKLDGANAEGAALAAAMLNLADEVATAEAKEGLAFQELSLRGGGGYGGAGGGPSSKMSKGRLKIDLETQVAELDVRVLLARLIDLRAGLNAVKGIAPADKQPVFDTIVAAIGQVLTKAGSEDKIDLEVASDVVTMANAIRTAIDPNAKLIEPEPEAEQVF